MSLLPHPSPAKSIGFSGGSVVKNTPAMQETQVPSLGRKIPWRTKWQPTPVFLPGESCGQRTLVGYSPWGCKESDTTKRLNNNIFIYRNPDSPSVMVLGGGVCEGVSRSQVELS